MTDNLSIREKEVLKYIVENFIHSAMPVGSRTVSKNTGLNLSSASIRNVMSDLEEKELLKPTHVSSGRIPTDKAYRLYVDALMSRKKLTKDEVSFISSTLNDKSALVSGDDFYSETSRILARMAHQLAVVSQPFLSEGVLEKIELVSLSSVKILVVINLSSGHVRTVVMEIDTEISRARLEELAIFLNERLAGLTLKQIRSSFKERVEDYGKPELLQLLIRSFEKIDGKDESGKIHIGGTGEIIRHPEFEDPKNFRKVVDLFEDKGVVLHIFKHAEESGQDVSITIGSENTEKKLKDYSVVSSIYEIKGVKGRIGIIGPRRMNYSKIVSLIEYTAKLISGSV